MKKILAAVVVLVLLLVAAPGVLGRFAETRINKGLDALDAKAPYLQIAERSWSQGWFSSSQEVVWEGEEVDLARLPVQTCWPGDAGPLITWGLTVTRGPRKPRQNLGIYRQQVIGRNKLIMRWLAHRGGALDYQDHLAASKADTLKALDQSHEAISKVVGLALKSDGKIANFKAGAAPFLSYLMTHDAHHRGQICLMAKQVGHPLGATVGYGMWEWSKR